MNNGLQAIQNDSNMFIDFVYGGDFSVPEDQRPSLPKQTQGISPALTTFLVSSAFANTGWNIAAVSNVDPLAITTNSSASLPDWATLDCTECHELRDLDCRAEDLNNSTGQCNHWWYSASLNTAFTLGGGNPGKNTKELLSKIFDNQWTTGALLFENVGYCDVFALWQDSDNNGSAIQRALAESFSRNVDFWTNNIADVTSQGPSVVLGITLAPNLIYDYVVSDYQYSIPAFNTSNQTIAIYAAGAATPHPPNTPYRYQSTGNVDFSCASQLGMQVRTTWEDVYYQHFP